MIRVFDLISSLVGLILLSPLLLIIYILCFLDTGSPLFIQQRVGKHRTLFNLIKFRTMYLDTPDKATHEIGKNSVTKLGAFLRSSKLDELPQLWNVLKGDMSLVGYRPNLPTQVELIQERDKLKIFNGLPGITGLSQINGIDMSDPNRLAIKDAEMMEKLTIQLYFYCILKTVLGNGAGDRVNNR